MSSLHREFVTSDQAIQGLEDWWRSRYPHFPWLASCHRHIEQGEKRGDDFVRYQADRPAPWGSASDLISLGEGLHPPPIRCWQWQSVVAMRDENEIKARWKREGSPPMVVIARPDDEQWLYKASTLWDEWAIVGTLRAWAERSRAMKSRHHATTLTVGNSGINPAIGNASEVFPHSPNDLTWPPTIYSSSPPPINANGQATIMTTPWTWREDQLRAMDSAKRPGIRVLTGGPGSGKTTVLAALLHQALAVYSVNEIAIAAPSGKAADRLNQSLSAHWQGDHRGLMAVTVEKLLGVGFGKSPRFHAGRRFPYRFIVLDECSMINTRRFAQFFRALPHDLSAILPTVVLCGDPNQLSAVEHGDVFQHLVVLGDKASPLETQESAQYLEAIRTHALIGNARAQNRELISFAQWVINPSQQTAESFPVPLNRAPVAPHTTLPPLYIPMLPEEPAAFSLAMQSFLQRWQDDYRLHRGALYQRDLPAVEGAQWLWDWWQERRILCAQNVGRSGTEIINRTWLLALNEFRSLPRRHEGKPFPHLASNQPTALSAESVNGAVVILTQPLTTAQGAGRLLANGATGVVWQGSVWFENQLEKSTLKAYPLSVLAYCRWGFSMTIHKAQGSEFESVCVIIPPDTRQLSRQVLYTGVTRAKKSLIVLSTVNTLITARNHLAHRLCAIGDYLKPR